MSASSAAIGRGTCPPDGRRKPAYAGRQGTPSPDTPSQRPMGLWKPVMGAMSQTFCSPI